MSRPATVAVLAALSLGSASCFEMDVSYRGEPWQPAQTPPANPQHVPVIGDIQVPKFPPVGPSGVVTVKVSDIDGDLSSVHVSFQKPVMRSVSGSLATLEIGGPELGEGYGVLTVMLWDATGKSSTRTVSNVLVDLTPPKIVLGQTVVSSQGELELWVGDAWILGQVRLEVGGQVLSHVFEPGWPETLGKTWDYSLVKFPMAGLPAQKGAAKLVATDAAGNTKTESFTLDIDATAPLVSIVSPAEGAALAGVATIIIESSDAGGGPVWVDVSLGGTPLGSLGGGKQVLSVNTAELLPGAHPLVVTATDQAGNQSVAQRSVTVE
ncbi:MAG: hypothetical protein HS104_38790 [Polyangiaceae bacterium]|nr:hypothetical protein [Polyangiaceae bacterium]MCE7888642.1 hypothetical protein [Sorangiineae bacterium PRO1]MCL4754823.1 hypothetical protein [Myxococcales bacterium]